MNNLTTQDLARIYGERIGQQLYFPEEGEWIIKGVYDDLVYYNLKDDKTVVSEPIESCKLLLTPLEKISDKHQECIAICEGISFDDECDIEFITKGFTGYWIRIARQRKRFVMYDSFQPQTYEWLKQNGYDLPMFFGIDHPDTGKTLIELGVAISKEKSDD